MLWKEGLIFLARTSLWLAMALCWCAVQRKHLTKEGRMFLQRTINVTPSCLGAVLGLGNVFNWGNWGCYFLRNTAGYEPDVEIVFYYCGDVSSTVDVVLLSLLTLH